jgi:hypothetical protein
MTMPHRGVYSHVVGRRLERFAAGQLTAVEFCVADEVSQSDPNFYLSAAQARTTASHNHEEWVKDGVASSFGDLKQVIELTVNGAGREYPVWFALERSGNCYASVLAFSRSNGVRLHLR